MKGATLVWDFHLWYQNLSVTWSSYYYFFFLVKFINLWACSYIYIFFFIKTKRLYSIFSHIYCCYFWHNDYVSPLCPWHKSWCRWNSISDARVEFWYTTHHPIPSYDLWSSQFFSVTVVYIYIFVYCSEMLMWLAVDDCLFNCFQIDRLQARWNITIMESEYDMVSKVCYFLKSIDNAVSML